ncbi:reductase [Lentilactobacillus laojiaonis]|uniref:reductase n=1 Tax=Lentilactobacillus laojiaonis TaxID=2883998 RepID=UPI001D09A420|nr:reductase [Lentilactobacillus laojiaonis]UDM31607.1 reductase [Lentilactobacillus laojiaonis]
MLYFYHKSYEKIAMGLLSLSKDISDMNLISQEINWYDTNDSRSLYLWKNDDQNWSGLVGIELRNEQVIVHELSLSPQELSQHNFDTMLSELQMNYPDSKIVGDLDNAMICMQWEKDRNSVISEDESENDIVEPTDAEQF